MVACGTDPLSGGGNGTPVLVGDADGSGGGPDLDGGTVESDSGGSDAGASDGGNVGLDIVVRDTGTTTDSGIEQVCEPRSTDCDGNVLLTCAGDGSGFGRTRCEAFGQVCEFTADGQAACVDDTVIGPDPVCEPGSSECSADGASLLTCVEDGSAYYIDECARGCDPDTLECAGEPTDPGECPFDFETIDNDPDGISFDVDLCGLGNSFAYEPGQNDCGDFSSGGEDQLFAITVESPSLISVDIRDNDDTTAIDTVAYLRSSCNDAETQITCGDDVPCADVPDVFGSCTDGEQVRVSRFEAEVEAGTYFLIVDSFNYRSGAGSFGCGNVQVSVSVTSNSGKDL
jgi:hypothetical protein